MLLQTLTPAELAFLSAEPVATGELPDCLTPRLAATLSARLRLPVELKPQRVPAPAQERRAPAWHPDAVLATLWLTRRLGGRQAVGVAPFIPRGLLRALDAALAEIWLDTATATPPTAMAWEIRAHDARAGLTLELPTETVDMTHWAREVIRHV